MKREFKVIISASGASFLAFSALAQDTLHAETDGLDFTRQRSPHARSPDRLDAAAKASDLLGITVNNYQDQKLGKVDNLTVDVQAGRIVAAVISSGGLFDMGDELSSVPPTALSFNAERKGILAAEDMSVSAKNVKIITNKRRVTLRGPVKSEEEKRLIGEIANCIARSENADNQVEVKLKITRN